MKPIAFFLALVLAAAPALAQQCRTGCPCGNTCISCSYTCRVGGGTASRGGGSAATGDDATAIIVGVLVGALAVSAALGLCSWFLYERSKAPPEDDEEAGTPEYGGEYAW